ncbi:hypothetical protein [Actinoplanes derwentensis]|uniref:Uncharacterized protein n=1 Tax=Actinoplanes derwentensis TaxID=113562 RepID=A0A1H2CSH9_9ACTN|nr:hypothetical protein [Actinoplanes derwentensis]GID85439.1 hypothetical protein Ade03nite_43630 [Actinoplanes derwentensis]SDT73112.1 hypothetical protein SAMN04489716_6578 [Actinoplanes derwentensis]
MDGFTNDAEQTAYSLAEALCEKAHSCMKSAEEASEAFRVGKMAMRRQFKARGLSEAEADIRWSATTQAARAIADNGFFMSQASMYNNAAAAQYAKALYHKS